MRGSGTVTAAWGETPDTWELATESLSDSAAEGRRALDEENDPRRFPPKTIRALAAAARRMLDMRVGGGRGGNPPSPAATAACGGTCPFSCDGSREEAGELPCPKPEDRGDGAGEGPVLEPVVTVA